MAVGHSRPLFQWQVAKLGTSPQYSPEGLRPIIVTSSYNYFQVSISRAESDPSADTLLTPLFQLCRRVPVHTVAFAGIRLWVPWGHDLTTAR